MTSTLFSSYRNSDLPSLITRLDKDYYSVLEALCLNASALTNEVVENYPSTSLYISLASKLIAQIDEMVAIRKETIFPYVADLSIKVAENHDCRNCSGSCHVGHSANLLSLKDSHKKIKEILFRLHSVALPLYTNTDYPATYKVLRNEVTVIDTLLTELFYIEEANLIPQVLQAQKTINA